MLRILLHTLLFFSLFFWISTFAHPPPASSGLPTSTLPESLSTPLVNQADQNKYFREPGGHEIGEDDRLGHYDTRYFHSLVSFNERTETLTHMIRAYITTFRELGLETWIAHGTLLGWWWNGKVSK